ncbi:MULTISPECIES: DUF4443 domain-containing protein [Metallosphaera]|uniref:DUF4443 domain-containing protein n=3 Tax=Metallosphaera TaxID=41980 RepID=A4YHF7_METS5|nr:MULTISPECIES: DUF4443 domain-containing protein [Metallosphaera]ABP95859.1 hypothetical protein Msed_1704 [Metallosphaera sedula DSM 5348]AIM27843.1 hypothetical protein HA72_1704 [Metallosphaera sedula]AKV74690.1 hypothetical protein MsedA_1738 [Metallosphaera sedula]AKV76928.1 hypothetical protein MsedB_1740 [Metallosphaera sedula]AKV79179.1 hypothetical protein MsedC_1738 [Metallosphaera sedula]
MSGISALQEATKPRQGNRPSYDEAYVMWALNLIHDEPPMGRLTLMKKLGLSEASVKTMLKRLREMGLITVDRIGGTELTEGGKKLVEGWRSMVRISEVYINSLNWKAIQLVILGGKNLVEREGVIQLRDLIIRTGAEATLITIKENQGIEIPPKTEDFSMKSLLQEVALLSSSLPVGSLIIYLIPQDIHLAYKVGISLLEHESRISG